MESCCFLSKSDDCLRFVSSFERIEGLLIVLCVGSVVSVSYHVLVELSDIQKARVELIET